MPKLSDFIITKRSVESLACDKDVTYRDHRLRGFAVRVKPSGIKTYLVVYRNKEGRTRSYALGQHGQITAEQARKEADKVLSEVKSGGDPAQMKSDLLKAATIKDLCELYIQSAEKGLILGKGNLPKKVSTIIEDKSRIARHIVPLIGKRKVIDLRASDITKFQRDVASGKTALDERTKSRGRARVTGGAGVASRTVGLLGGIMSYAISEGLIEVNPCRGVKRPSDGKRQVRLSPEQYRALGAALSLAEANGEPWQSVAAIRLLALTGCRLGEVTRLKWAEVDLSGHALRLSDSKTGKSVRPIGGAALKILAELPRSCDYVFPATRLSNAPYGSLPKAWGRVIALAKNEEANPLEGLTPHGLRHAFASVGGDLGLSEITIAALIGHASASVTGRYIHALDSALIAMADKVCQEIETQMKVF